MNKRNTGSGSIERSASEMVFVLRNAGRKTGPEVLRHVAGATAGAQAAGEPAGSGPSPKRRAAPQKPARKRSAKKT